MADSELTGRIVLPDNPDYNCARQVFNTRFSKFPSVIVYCRSVNDVTNAVRWSRENAVPLRVRCGGHSYEAFSVLDGGLVVDVSCMTDLWLNPARTLAKIEAGNTLLALYERLYHYGVTIPGGTCPGVGVSGLTLGAGFGMLTRLWGMTCDNLLALEMVDANGRLLFADKDTNADLFWACQGGGGGNFGIVTAFIFKLRPISHVSIFEITWPWCDLTQVVDAWQTWAPFTDNRLTSTIRIYTKETGKIVASGQFVGPNAQLIPLLKPLLAAGNPLKVDIQTVPYSTAALRWAGIPGDPNFWPRAPLPFKNTGSFAYRVLPSEAISLIADKLSDSPTPENWLTLQALGGAASEVPPSATAYVHRCALFALLFDSFPPCKEATDANIRWVENFRTNLLPYTNGAYVNFPDLCIENWPESYYGANFPRLVEVKQKYDPCDVFHFPQSIPTSLP